MSDHEVPSPPDLTDARLSGSAPLAAPLLIGPGWQEQDAILRDLWQQNKTPQQIGEALGRSVAAIMTRAARLGLPRRAAPGRKPGSRRLPPVQEENVVQTRAAIPRQRIVIEGDEPEPQPSKRICLMCLRGFQSQGRHNRICVNCKATAEYGAAVALADIHFPV